jgi:hypothetical protein
VVSLRNTAEKVIQADYRMPILDVRFAVVAPDGKSVKCKKDLDMIESISASSPSLKKNEVLAVTINLSELYDFDQPGTYTITAKRQAKAPIGPNPTRRWDVLSNELKLVVAEKR